MKQHLPFYMTYQPFETWNEEMLSRKDYEYMKCAYPDTAKRLMPFVEEECDRWEYSGSMIFDEYPDQLQMRFMCRRIYDKYILQNPGESVWELVQVLLYHEILKRRSEYRKYRRKFY